MLNIVIPMAGRGSRFKQADFKMPKPFIDVCGKPMIQHVVENLMPYQPHRFIFLARREHEKLIKQHMSFATNVIYVDEVTEGAACTVLLAKNYIDSVREPLIIANSDQLVRWNFEEHSSGGGFYWKESNNIQDMINDATWFQHDACIATFYSNHPKWSYAKLDDNEEVVEVAEKKVISPHATVGIYYYKRGCDFVKYAEQMIAKDLRVNNEFYVCPVFNEMIDASRQIGVYGVGHMMGMGTPEDLAKTEKDLNDSFSNWT